ncbi:MAG: ABC transporter substrate-binding protein, partial [Nitrosopumilaceae archaeon]|nr:ABC transporter substrate-binding protein [Nitrosopumilaceae archaeon]NIU01616.1 ABC transporter substrate-binding protein [Nitrosopumilaceae archaeon]NIU88035.1 ABC transporter substrate-binding protein [Nitrosopumilaceae archaeon]NIV66302.1 ABC transporter substrate-binding protein [Nitrosopumilaceae archaeon]NIX62218.1 ABC transporter substrate-binding protein [Nitrosopumilaceae archaeon]
ELSKIGFKVNKEFGDLNKAFVVVYGSDPAASKWHLYTEGWGGRSAFVRYDSVGLGQMYAPWFSNMPGFNDPTYWNYQNKRLDEITQRIYTGDFATKEEREELIRQATIEGIDEAVRIFLASKIDQYVTNESVNGVVNDFGAGVPSRFTPINAKIDSDLLKIGVKQIYQGAWNPVGGLSDAYSKHIWDVLFDPALFKDPYNGQTIPIRLDWKVETNGPTEKIELPKDVITWDTTQQQWQRVNDNATASSKVTFDISFSNWHNGVPMDMKDLLYSFYFTLEWGSTPTENDKTFDTEFTPRATQLVKTLKGIRVLDNDTIEVYVDYWHFDQGEIADWASIWSSMPWEVFAAMEQAVIDGKVSFSRSGAVSKNVNWLSLIVPNDANIIKQYLQEFKNEDFVPKPLDKFEDSVTYYDNRYESSIDWIDKYNHAVISNGPFYLESYSPESRTITIKVFADDSYPFESGKWSKFENPEIPKITSIKHSPLLVKKEPFDMKIKTTHATDLQYFMINSDGKIVEHGRKTIKDSPLNLHLTAEQTDRFEKGAADLKLFAISKQVLRPDFFTTSILVTNEGESVPQVQVKDRIEPIETQLVGVLVVGVTIVVAVLLFVYKKKIMKPKQYGIL